MSNLILKLIIKYITYYIKHHKDDSSCSMDLTSYRYRKVNADGSVHHTFGINHYICKCDVRLLLAKRFLDTCNVEKSLEITEEFDSNSLITQKDLEEKM